MSETARSPSLVKSLYNHNPFYAISAALMLISVRTAYGELEIGTINCWIMTGVLAAYTLVLAVLCVSIIRWGKVWEDARSIFLLLLLLFLAVSISVDELFIKMTSEDGGSALLLVGVGYCFAAIVSEVVLRAARIRLGLGFRIPYHLILALFYVAPWWCAPELHQRSRAELEWNLLLFPLAAAVLLLTLLPAVRKGAAYVAESGTPWRWPWYPWTAFGLIAGFLGFRSFALCLSFGPNGTIWQREKYGSLIIFDTIWGTYFLIPLALAVLILLLEAGLVSKSRRLIQCVMAAAPVLLLLALPIGGEFVFPRFLNTFVRTIASPMWLTVWLLVGFYAWGWLRRAPGAGLGVVSMLGFVSVVGRSTVNLESLAVIQPWPFLAIGLVLLIRGLWVCSSLMCASSSIAATLGLWLWLPQTNLADFRFNFCFHLLWMSIVIWGLVFRDRFAHFLRVAGAVQMPVVALVLMVGDGALEITYLAKLIYLVLLAASCLTIARLWHSRWYLYAFFATFAILGYAATVQGFRQGVELIGRTAVTAFAWSLGMLVVAFLISAHKARWLPQSIFPGWRNGNGLRATASDQPHGGPIEPSPDIDSA